MNVGGLATMTLLDYPGKVAATIFTNGCNFRCPFCQNADLVLTDCITDNAYSENNILDFLRKRKNLLEGVCISGGEPTLQSDLPEFICKIKSLGYSVKLDTNGLNPAVISSLIEGNLVDYIAMDYKAPYHKYALASGIDNIDISKIKESVHILINSKIDYEFRTTLVKGIHTCDDMTAMAHELNGAKAYYLQSYVDSSRIIGKLTSNDNYSSFTPDELNDFLSIIKKELPEAKLRGVS